MIKEIKYNGFTANPDDYQCADGDLSVALNVVPEEESLHPVMPPEKQFTLPNGYKIILVHKNTGYIHYIIQKGNNLYWLGKGSGTPTITEIPDNVTIDNLSLIGTFTKGMYGANAIGNVICVLTDPLSYVLWKPDSQNYQNLGVMPEIDIQFEIQKVVEASDIRSTTVTLTGTYPRNITTNNISITQPTDLTDTDSDAVTEPILALVNKAVNESQHDGYFIFPFFVRYAYRLFDGNTTHASPPILVMPSTKTCPFTPHTWDGSDVRFHADQHYKLLYYIPQSSQINKIKDWNLIISSIDVFISQPIYNYNQAGKCKKLLPDTSTFGAALFELPQFGEELDTKVTSVENFYFYRSIPVNELVATTSTEFERQENELNNITTHERLTDDYDSHDTLISRYAFTYNSRLNITQLSKNKFKGFSPVMCVNKLSDEPPVSRYLDCYVHINTDNGTTVVNVYSSLMKCPGGIVPNWFYYPDSNAFKTVWIVHNEYKDTDDYNDQDQIYDDVYFYEIPLKKHDFLNGSYYFNDFQPPTSSLYRNDGVSDPRDLDLDDTISSSLKPFSETNKTTELPNKIYTSEVNNPFSYPVLGINTVGTGKIIAIASAVKALSQGQFGQFPLYAFTDEGVWALEVSSTGTYSTRQPVTRDVVLRNGESITQIDTAVLFATDRGIMILSGSNTACISDSIDSENLFVTSSLPYLDDISNDVSCLEDYVPFKQYIQNCRMLYDYTHQRIILFNPSRAYAYIYSLKSKLWGMMPSNIQYAVNAYPEAWAVTERTETETVERQVDGETVEQQVQVTYQDIVNFSSYATQDSESETTETYHQLLVTRPIKLDYPNALKTVDTIIQRGYFHKGNIQSVLFGSRDLFNWHLVYSSTDHYLRGFRGTPYKYFRIALLCQLAPDESVYGCTVQYTPRLTDQPR